MILISGRIFVICVATRHVCAVIRTNIGKQTGIAHIGILQELEMSNYDKTRPACQWDDAAAGKNFLKKSMYSEQ